MFYRLRRARRPLPASYSHSTVNAKSRGVLQALRAFGDDESGAFAMMFGIMAIVLIALAGSVVDYTHLENNRAKTQVALDAAALALQPRIYEDPAPSEDEIKAQVEALVRQQLGANADFVMIEADIDLQRGALSLTGRLNVEMAFVSLVGVPSLSAAVSAETARGHTGIELAVALDLTGSMIGQRMTDLKVAATDLVDIITAETGPGTSARIALVPYSVGVNLGSAAGGARGPIDPAHPVSAAYWSKRPAVAISAVTRTNPVVVTAAGHGLSDGDAIYITGVGGMTQINDRAYSVSGVSGATFRLQGVDGQSFGDYSGGGAVAPCAAASCEVIVTAAAHGIAAGQVVYLKNIGGMSQISNRLFRVRNVFGNDLVLEGTLGPRYNAFSSGGDAYCVVPGCQYYYFKNALGGMRFFEVSTCVSERTPFPNTDVAPSKAYVGRNYAASANPCSLQSVTPLSSDADLLKGKISALNAGGSTGGHLGVAWAWYMLSPEFAQLWPSANRLEAYGKQGVSKIAIIMTDGEYNSVYCNGVISQISTIGSGSPEDHINCDAPNGNPYYQANRYCAAMKASGVIVYTVGFQIVDSAAARSFMADCASTPDTAYLAENGDALREAFVDIATSIQSLRITQ